LQNLKSLKIGSNQINEINDLKSLQKLEKLSLNHNKISEIKGTLAGFRLPDYSKVINVPGYLRKFYLKITSLVGTYCIAKLNLDSYQ